MTSTIIIRQRNAVSVLTDGAGYDADGTLRAEITKVWPLPHLDAVIAFNGPGLAAAIAITAIHAGVGGTYDSLKHNVGNAVQDASTDPRMAPNGAMRPMLLYVAGISETVGPDAYAVSNCDVPAIGLKAFDVAQLGPFTITPGDAELQEELWNLLPDTGATELSKVLDNIRPDVDGMAIIELQRQRRWAGAEHAPIYSVGCHALLTTVTHGGISSRILKRWPDKLGKKIDPLAELRQFADIED